MTTFQQVGLIGWLIKYRVQLFQIAGLSLFAPIGKIFIDIKDMGLKDLNLAFLV